MGEVVSTNINVSRRSTIKELGRRDWIITSERLYSAPAFTGKSGGPSKVWNISGAAALRSQAVLARYGLSEVQLHREVKQSW